MKIFVIEIFDMNSGGSELIARRNQESAEKLIREKYSEYKLQHMYLSESLNYSETFEYRETMINLYINKECQKGIILHEIELE